MILKRLHPDFYMKKGDTKLFPMPSNQKVNEYLKEIASICNINKNLTFHTARHNETHYYLLINRLRRIRLSIGNDLETSLVLRYA